MKWKNGPFAKFVVCLIHHISIEILYNWPVSNWPALSLISAVGCSNLVPPADSWMRRTDNEATIGCYTTRQRWHLRCHEGQWKGTFGQCAEAERLTGLYLFRPFSPHMRKIPPYKIECESLCTELNSIANDESDLAYTINQVTKAAVLSPMMQPKIVSSNTKSNLNEQSENYPS